MSSGEWTPKSWNTCAKCKNPVEGLRAALSDPDMAEGAAVLLVMANVKVGVS